MEITGSSIDDVVWSAAAGHSNNAPNVEATKPKLTFHIGGVGGWSTLVPKMVGAKKSAGPTNYCEMHGKCMVCTITSLLSCQRYFGLNTRSSTRSTSSTSPKKKTLLIAYHPTIRKIKETHTQKIKVKLTWHPTDKGLFPTPTALLYHIEGGIRKAEGDRRGPGFPASMQGEKKWC